MSHTRQRTAVECPTDDRLNMYVARELVADELARIAAHCPECPSCQALVEVLAADTPGLLRTPQSSRQVVAGDTVGRYVLLDRIGAGGMGVVWAAYDPVLDRNLAIKFLGTHDRDVVPELRTRFDREARITARLQHPAIVHIQEAGAWPSGDPFYVMKLVVGESLEKVIADRPVFADRLSLISNVATVVDALGYAHGQGVVHRDLKPQNVVVGEFGETVVLDWGLATRRTDDGETRSSGGSVIGTPAYMPPEQAAGGDVDERADVYALGAILYHVLAGSRPYAIRPAHETVAAVLAGPPVPLATLAPGAPLDLVTIVNKAMARAVGDRYPTAKQLADELKKFLAGQLVDSHRYSVGDHVRRWWRRHRTVVMAAVIVVLAGTAVFALSRDANAPDTRCEGMDHKLFGVWDPYRAGAVRAAFVNSKRSYGADTFDRVTRQLERYSHAWVSARVEACEATHRRGEQSAALLDLRMACLDRRLAEVGSLVDVFASRADPDVLDKAVEATGKLSSIRDCADVDALRTSVPMPGDPQTRAKVAALGRALAEAKALDSVGRYRDGLAIAQATATAAAQLSYPPLLASALEQRALLEEGAGDSKAAEATFELALVSAASARDDALAARIWAYLITTVGYRLSRPDEALRLRPGAEAAVRRAGSLPEAEARLLNSLGLVFDRKGKHAESADYHQGALALREALGSDQPEIAASLNNLGVALFGQAKYGDARRHYERALAILETTLGPAHPRVAVSLNNLAHLLDAQGNYDEAERMYERGLLITENALGPHHPDVALSLTNLGHALAGRGANDEARARFARALAITEHARGPDHPDVAFALLGLGNVAEAQHDLDGARRHYERALAIRERALGPDHHVVADALSNLANVLNAQGDYEAARRYHARALAIMEKELGPDHPFVAYSLTWLGETLLSLRRHEEARVAAERALVIHAAGGTAPDQLAITRFVLARAMWELGRDRPRALALAGQALEQLEKAGDAEADKRADVERWVRARTGR